jgi:outer membrane immunogenic protein
MRSENLLMKKLMLGSAALASVSIPTFAADMPIKVPGVAVPAFAWSGCFLGAHAGGGWARKDVTDPVALVEENAFATLATGVTTAQNNPSGAVIGGQVGCDYQVVPNWVVGVEGSASGATMKGSTTVDLIDVAAPLSSPQGQTSLQAQPAVSAMRPTAGCITSGAASPGPATNIL